MAFRNFLYSGSYLLMCDHRLSLELLLVQCMGWLVPGELTEQVGRKVHRARALPLASLKGLAVEEAEDASRKTQVLPCWFLPGTSCRQLFSLRENHRACLSFSVRNLRPRSDLLMCWACIKAEVLQKCWVLGPEHFKLSIHILRKFWLFQHCSWPFVHKRIIAFPSSRIASQINTRLACENYHRRISNQVNNAAFSMRFGWYDSTKRGKIRIAIRLSCALSRWSSAEVVQDQ